ncbi:MAG: succinylglutamate desuccinylase/aspartoacylase family protein [Acidobacteria bacterium]|nr:succinylglutamate desuccinylase/aspartoacylase family protein [Acidobacteriota bacterium]
MHVAPRSGDAADAPGDESAASISHRHAMIAWSLIVAIVVVVWVADKAFAPMSRLDLVIKGPGVARETKLSEYFPGLKATPGDTDVYVLGQDGPGTGSVLVLGGTHPNEPGGYLAATVLIEAGSVSKGRVFVIPFACKSGFSHNDPGEASPQRFEIRARGGVRSFRYGSRAINPLDSWPDPDVYVHAQSGQRLSGEETRNLNRAFPGRPNGTLAERVAHGIAQLILRERVDLTIDLHEAMPEYPNINVIVAHQRALPLAADAQATMMLDGMQISLSPSPPRLHGLSHRELGDHTPTLAVLMETPNIAIGRLRGPTTTATVLEGRDPFYVWGARLGRLFVPFDDTGWPLDVRVGRHVTGVAALVESLSTLNPSRRVVLKVPRYREIVERGVGWFLNSPQ